MRQSSCSAFAFLSACICAWSYGGALDRLDSGSLRTSSTSSPCGTGRLVCELLLFPILLICSVRTHSTRFRSSTLAASNICVVLFAVAADRLQYELQHEESMQSGCVAITLLLSNLHCAAKSLAVFPRLSFEATKCVSSHLRIWFHFENKSFHIVVSGSQKFATPGLSRVGPVCKGTMDKKRTRRRVDSMANVSTIFMEMC